jgi:hypothetical protein
VNLTYTPHLFKLNLQADNSMDFDEITHEVNQPLYRGLLERYVLCDAMIAVVIQLLKLHL